MIVAKQSRRLSFSRRGIIAGALAAGGLWVGWKAWPRATRPPVRAADGETVLGGFIKIGKDGHVTLVTPQIELGQGSHTLLAQIVADELGADWRTMAVEPAPVHAFYANDLLAKEWGAGGWRAPPLQATGGATSVRGFAGKLREAAAGARILLSMAAAEQWDASWEACETDQGFVMRGKDRARFGELAARAGELDLPERLAWRQGGSRLWGAGVDRLDVPAKLDGSANFSGDIRLPDLAYAAISMGPAGASRLAGYNRKAGDKANGFIDLVETPEWLAVVASSWWAAKAALKAMKPRHASADAWPDSRSALGLLNGAFKGKGNRIAEQGDAPGLIAGGKAIEAQYAAQFGFHGALEPMSATAAISGNRMDLWVATQNPGAARAAASRATGIEEDRIAVHAMLTGGSFGRKLEVEIAGQVALIAQKLGRPIQLIWSRSEDMAQDRPRPAAQAKYRARLEGGRLAALEARIATNDGTGAMLARAVDGASLADSAARDGGDVSARAIEGVILPYELPAFALEHLPVATGVASGKLRSGANGFTCFFGESFIDELAHAAGLDGFSYRMSMLASNVRLAQCLTKVVTRGGWEGGQQGHGQGLACYGAQGSFIAVLAEASLGADQRPVVTKLVAVADVGRVLNPDIARQQIEGGLLHGLALATGSAIAYQKGVPQPNHFAAHGWPTLAMMPEISVELVRSGAESGGIGELALPPVAPAIANAIHTGSGVRLRHLPLGGDA